MRVLTPFISRIPEYSVAPLFVSTPSPTAPTTRAWANSPAAPVNLNVCQPINAAAFRVTKPGGR
jgi:hypothetical protein